MNLCRLTNVSAGTRQFGRAAAAFTMVEIAIAMAIIAFALVAIIGVLPFGLNVQKDNREDTIINQDGTYWLEAIRSGSQGIVDLPKYVDRVYVGNRVTGTPGASLSGAAIIGLLSQPGVTNVAEVRAISGALAMQATASTNVAFSYLLRSEITPRPILIGTNWPVLTNLYDVRLTLSWPLLPNGNTGPGRQIFRAMVSGYLAPTNLAGLNLYFFERQTFSMP